MSVRIITVHVETVTVQVKLNLFSSWDCFCGWLLILRSLLYKRRCDNLKKVLIFIHIREPLSVQEREKERESERKHPRKGLVMPQLFPLQFPIPSKSWTPMGKSSVKLTGLGFEPQSAMWNPPSVCPAQHRPSCHWASLSWGKFRRYK